MLIKCGGYRLFKKGESLVPYSHFFFSYRENSSSPTFLAFWWDPLRSFRKERILESHSLQPFLSILRSRARESQYDVRWFFQRNKALFFSFERTHLLHEYLQLSTLPENSQLLLKMSPSLYSSLYSPNPFANGDFALLLPKEKPLDGLPM